MNSKASKIEQLPKNRAKGRQRRVSLKICAVVIAVLIIVGGICGVKLAYDKGRDEGVQTEKQNVEQNLKSLAEAVIKKAEMAEKVEVLARDLPEELDAEGIKGYIDKLEQLRQEIQDEKVQEILTEYQQAWTDYEEVYKSEDNEKIEVAFSELRAKAAETGEKITDYYDEQVKKGAEDLQK